MRIISLVPSWTETLLFAGLNVVGRTRYCVHPSHEVNEIPSVGGTKSLSLDKIERLEPDLIVMDKEENTLEISQQLSHLPQFVSHVTSLESLPNELSRLAELTRSSKLTELANQHKALLAKRPAKIPLDQLPGVTKWLRPIHGAPKRVIYLIWHDPWMAVNQDTFIGSMFDWMGFELWSPSPATMYPTLEINDIDSAETLVLASSEPYPFARKEELLTDLKCSSAIVDGEAFSWFGLRSHEFLKSITKG